jgi:F-type H+-transporting ATPase subunit b
MIQIKGLHSRILFLLVTVLSPVLVLANEEAHGGHHGLEIPTAVTYQAINFLIYAGLLLYFLRHPVRNFFKTREEAYKQALIKAESARHEAEARKSDIQKRLHAFESSANESLQKAKADAEALKKQIQKEASDLADRLKAETQRSAALEIEKARNLLREEVLAQSILQAKKLLSDKIADGDQQRLQTEFVDKIQEVR